MFDLETLAKIPVVWATLWSLAVLYLFVALSGPAFPKDNSETKE